MFYTFLGMIADALDIILTSVIPDKRPQRSIMVSKFYPFDLLHLPVFTRAQPLDEEHLTNEDVLELRRKGPKLHPEADVVKLTPNTVVKISQDFDEDVADASEANTLDLLFAKTTIPVPRVRRVVKYEGIFFIVMDYIPGLTLDHIWPNLSIWRKVRVAFTLRRYVRQLRHLKAPATTPPGPLSAHGARSCFSPAVFG